MTACRACPIAVGLDASPGTRELVAVYPYVIAYEIGPDAVMILNVWHGGLLA